jgi:hypothetical protein
MQAPASDAAQNLAGGKVTGGCYGWPGFCRDVCFLPVDGQIGTECTGKDVQHRREVKNMPRGDGTGPMGMGPMTGRGTGFCAGFETPGYMSLARFGCGFGGGRGFRRMFYATGVPGWARYGADANGETADEKTFLKNQASFLEKQLEQVKKRLSHFEGNAE